MARRSGSDGQATEAAVFAAAERLFAQKGFAAVSMRALAAEVGVQVGTLYLYVPDKQTLLSRLLERHMHAVLDAWARADPGGQAQSRLDAFTRFHVGFHLERPDAVFIAYMELRALTPENFARIESLRRRYEADLEAILRDPHFALPDPRVTSLAIIAMLTGVTTWYRDGGRLSRADVVARYLDLVRAMVAHRQPAA